jgi:hypothetical protein
MLQQAVAIQRTVYTTIQITNNHIIFKAMGKQRRAILGHNYLTGNMRKELNTEAQTYSSAHCTSYPYT